MSGTAYRHMGQSFTGGGGAGVTRRQLHHQGVHRTMNNNSRKLYPGSSRSEWFSSEEREKEQNLELYCNLLALLWGGCNDYFFVLEA